MKIETFYDRTETGETKRTRMEIPARLKAFEHVQFMANKKLKPTIEHEQAIEYCPQWLINSKFSLSIGGVCLLMYSVFSTVFMLDPVKYSDGSKFFISAFLCLIGGMVDYSFYRVSNAIFDDGMIGRQYEAAQRLMWTALVVMTLGAMNFFLSLLNLMPDALKFVYVMAQMGGGLFWLWMRYVIVDLNPARIDAIRAFEREREMLNVSEAMKDQFVSSIKNFVHDDGKNIISDDLAKQFGRAVRMIQLEDARMNEEPKIIQRRIEKADDAPVIRTNDTIPHPVSVSPTVDVDAVSVRPSQNIPSVADLVREVATDSKDGCLGCGAQIDGRLYCNERCRGSYRRKKAKKQQIEVSIDGAGGYGHE